MKLLNLPNVIVNKIMLFDSHPCADMIKKLRPEIMTNTYYEVDEHKFHKTSNYFSEDDSFVENWQEWHFMNHGEIEEKRKEFIKKYELPDDSDDKDL